MIVGECAHANTDTRWYTAITQLTGPNIIYLKPNGMTEINKVSTIQK